MPNEWSEKVMELIDQELLRLRPEKVITGMAQGVDQWVAGLCLENDIPYIAAVPFEGQEKVWPAGAQALYKMLLSRAEKVVIVCSGGYSASKMHQRNHWIVQNCHQMLAVWDGSPGGTAGCVQEAQSRGRPIHFVKLPPGIPKTVKHKAASAVAPPPGVIPVSPALFHPPPGTYTEPKPATWSKSNLKECGYVPTCPSDPQKAANPDAFWAELKDKAPQAATDAAFKGVDFKKLLKREKEDAAPAAPAGRFVDLSD